MVHLSESQKRLKHRDRVEALPINSQDESCACIGFREQSFNRWCDVRGALDGRESHHDRDALSAFDCAQQCFQIGFAGSAE
jgi:hypothetical protein